MSQSTLVLNGQTGYPISYAGLKKQDFNHLHNVRTLVEMKKNKSVIKKDTEEKINKIKNYTSVKDKLLSFFKLKTINGQSCVELSELSIFCKKSFLERIKSIQLKNDCRCNSTGKLIIVPDWIERKKYISFSWLLEVIVSNYGAKYFHSVWLRRLV
jgi:cysteinyl-tRNA synthetase